MKLSPKSYKLEELTRNLDEVLIQGNPNCMIEGVCTIQNPKPKCITFLTNPLYKKYLTITTAAAVILLPEDAKHCPVNALISKDPYFIYAKIATYFDDKPKQASGIHETAEIGLHCDIDPSASIGAYAIIGDYVKIRAQVVIGPHCVISDNTEIEEGSYLDAHVTLYHRTKLGKRVRVSSGTVIGSDGFGYANQKGNWQKVPQLGRVVIEDEVEIGANCAIDRGAIEDTIIKKA